MKKYIYKSIFILSLIAMVSCGDDFLDTLPTQEISSASITATTGNLMLGVNGIHRSLYVRYDSQGEGGVGGIMITMDVMGEDFVHTSAGNGWYNAEYQWNMHTNDQGARTRYPYRVYYQIIRNANVIINGADGAEGPQAIKNMAKGQALVYRAFCHFQLVQMYGSRYVAGQQNSQLGVPILLIDTNDPQPRSTVEEVYAQIHADLDEAIQLLQGYQRPNKSHLDQSVARGLKARVALVQGNYTMAITNAQMARQGYPLMTNNEYLSGFNSYTNGEWMWGSHIVEDQTTFFANFGAYVSRNFNSTNIRTNPKAIFSVLYDQLPETDIRRALWDPTGQHNNLPAGVTLPSNFVRFPYTSQKFISVSTADSRMDVVYMRAAEMFLIEAEAKARLGQNDAAQVLFDLVSPRDPEYTLSSNTGQALIDEILFYRRIELWGEGFRWLDLKRLNSPLDRRGGNHLANLINNLFEVAAGDNRWQYQIPISEMNNNPLMIQNPQ